MKKITWFIKSMLSDEKRAISSKRVCGFLCTLMLCAVLFSNQFMSEHKPSDTLVECITALAFGCLGLTSFDKFSNRKNNNNDTNSQQNV